MRRWWAYAVCGFSLLVFVLGGCSNRVEVERLAHVVVLGLDLVDDDYIKVTFQVANPQVGSTLQGEAQGEPPSDIVSIVATDLLTAKELANTIIPRRISFTHLQTLIVSEKLARSDHFHKMIASQNRQPDIRREMNLIVCREEALEFIKKNKPRMETRPHKYYQYMMEQWRATDIVPLSTMNTYLYSLGGELFLAVYATTEKLDTPKSTFEGYYRAGEVPAEEADPVQMMGSAVFKNGKMIGTINGEETRLSLMLRRKSEASVQIVSFPDPITKHERITVRVMRVKGSRIDLDLSSDIPEIHVSIPLRLQVLSIRSLINYATDERKTKLLEQTIEEIFEEEAAEFVRKAQKELRGDPFEWSLEARKKFWTWDEYIDYDWTTKFSMANVKVDFVIDIESFGKQLAPSVIQGKE